MTRSGAMQQISRIATISAMVLIGVLVVWSVWIPRIWIYKELALRIAFGSERASQEHITVGQITKPSTVTFSNGEKIDVGMKPALFSTIFFLVAGPLVLVGYIRLLKRYGPKWIEWHPTR